MHWAELVATGKHGLLESTIACSQQEQRSTAHLSYRQKACRCEKLGCATIDGARDKLPYEQLFRAVTSYLRYHIRVCEVSTWLM